MIPNKKMRDLRTATDNGEPVVVSVKPWYLSKTLWLNVIVFLIAVIGVLMGPQFAEVLPKEWGKYLLAIVSVLNLLLRLLSSQPLDGGTQGGNPPRI